MESGPRPLASELTNAHAEALRVGDSPLRADRLADQLERVLTRLEAEELTEEQQARIGSALENAVRVLRRDDDGREAARHLQSAARLLDDRPRKQSPFLDDLE